MGKLGTPLGEYADGSVRDRSGVRGPGGNGHQEEAQQERPEGDPVGLSDLRLNLTSDAGGPESAVP